MKLHMIASRTRKNQYGKHKRVNKRHARTESDKCIHIGYAFKHGNRSVFEKFVIDAYNNSRKYKLVKRKPFFVTLFGIEKWRNGRPEHMPHRYVHQRHKQTDRNNKPYEQLFIVSNRLDLRNFPIVVYSVAERFYGRKNFIFADNVFVEFGFHTF